MQAWKWRAERSRRGEVLRLKQRSRTGVDRTLAKEVVRSACTARIELLGRYLVEQRRSQAARKTNGSGLKHGRTSSGTQFLFLFCFALVERRSSRAPICLTRAVILKPFRCVDPLRSSTSGRSLKTKLSTQPTARCTREVLVARKPERRSDRAVDQDTGGHAPRESHACCLIEAAGRFRRD